MTSNTTHSPAASAAATARPAALLTATVLLGLIAVLNIVGPLMPSSDGVIGFGIISAVIALVAIACLLAGGLWTWFFALIVAAVNLVLSVPGVFVGATTSIKIVAGVSCALCVAALLCLARPEVRRHFSEGPRS